MKREKIVKTLNRMSMQTKNIRIIDHIETLCNQEYCSSYIQNSPVYYDDDHINYNLKAHLTESILKILK